MQVVYKMQRGALATGLSLIAADFAGQIATAVWLGKLTGEAAREALWCYSLACHRGKRWESIAMREALTVEYRRRRERQDACS